MRFRHKVIMINILVLSFALGILGLIMIRKNFNYTLSIEANYSVKENNIIQASIEYRLLDTLKSNNNDMQKKLYEAGNYVSRQLMTDDTTLYIVYGGELSFCNKTDYLNIPDKLYEDTLLGAKTYITEKNDKGYFLFVCSHILLFDKDLYIISCREVTSSYNILYDQIKYFLLFICLVLAFCGVILYLMSIRLTRPLEELNTITDSISNGDYSVSLDLSSDDEVGHLAKKFNSMTIAIATHVDELNDMIKRREQFVADFTHEIKTPMTAIIGYADILRKRDLSNERKLIAYDYIYNEGKRLETMSMKLFDLIYLRDNEILLSEQKTDKIAKEVSCSMQPLLKSKGITLVTEVDAATIYAEAELLKTVLINLIDNAKKATDEGGKILFKGYKENDNFIYQVTDYGCGMDEETISHIYDEFFMADKSRSRTEGGAGLGMSLVLIIAKRHNAALDIKSKPGEGTTITFALPLS